MKPTVGRSSNRLLRLLLVWHLSGATAFAQSPSGGTIVGGSGTVGQHGTTTTIQQSSDRLAIDWHTFDIGVGHSVIFNQPSARSVALNRVLGGSRSEVFGSLQANGNVFLVNPNGVLVGRTAEVNVGGLVATTKNISDVDFMAGRYRFTGPDTGEVINQGHLRAIKGGYIVLAGGRVRNEGAISAPGGSAVLAAADTLTLQLDAAGRLSVDVDGATVNALIENGGLIEADGGRVLLTARGRDLLQASVINLSGVVRARSVQKRNGVIVIDGGVGGGDVILDGATVDASGLTAGERGGRVEVSGRNVGLFGATHIDARGSTGGGTVLVGGEWQGSGTLPHAEAVVMQNTSRIDASAISRGDGGTVVLWSDRYTGFFGNVSARGGAIRGNGGAVETSSHDNLQAFGSVDASAPAGGAGTWLLDPTNVALVTGAANLNATDAGGVFTPTGSAGAQIGVDNVNADLNAGTSVTINTASAGTQAGTITQNAGANISKTAGGNATLTMNASGAMTLNGSVTSSAGTLGVTLSSPGTITHAAGQSINTNGGALTVNAQNATLAGTYNTGGGTTLNLSGAGTLSGVVTGSGGLAINGGSLAINAAQTFTGAFTAVNSTVSLSSTMNNVSSASFTNSTLSLAPAGTWSFGSLLTLNNSTVTDQANNCCDAVANIMTPVMMTGNNTVDWSHGGAFQLGINFRAGWQGSGNVTVRSFSGFRGLVNVTGSMANYSGNITASSAGAPGSPFWVQFNSNDGWGTGTLNVTGGNVSVNYNLNTNFRLPYFGNTNPVNQPAATLNVTGGAFYTGNNVTIGALQGAAAGTLNLTGAGRTFTTGALNSTATYAGVITGPGAFAKNGTGTQILSGNNTYSGTTAISSGTLQVGNNGASGTLGTGAVTTNANLVFNRSDTVNLSALASNAGGIVGTGNVSARIGGALTIDRPIALTGAGSSILLEAGKNNAAGDVSGGNVTLSTAISTSGTGTVTIFSGSANTAVHEASITGASGEPRRKTYNASAAATAGAVAGTRNYYYRQAPVLTVSGLTASKRYDGLLDATAVLDTSSMTVSGGIEGDVISGASLTLASARFDDAHAGARTVTGQFGVGALNYSSGGVNWSVSGYSAAGSGAATITQRPVGVTATIAGANKVYDGLLTATGSTLAASTTGAVAGDTVTVDTSGYTLRFDDPHAGGRTISATGSASFNVTSSNTSDGVSSPVAGRMSDYSLTQPAIAPVTATISPRPLTTQINPVDKTYDGTTMTTSTLGPLSGFVGNDSATGLAGAALAFGDHNAGPRNITLTGTPSLDGFAGVPRGDGRGLAAGNEVAGLSRDYQIVSPSPASATIFRAPLTIFANDDAKLFTESDSPGYNGVSFTGFVNGERASDLRGALSITRSNAGTDAVGSYTAVVVPSGYISDNYSITYAAGNYQILGARQLFVRIQNLTHAYGTVPGYAISSVRYLDQDGSTITTLSQTSRSGDTYTYSDGSGGTATFTVTPANRRTSGAGFLAAGNYTVFGANTQVTGVSLTGQTYVGNETVTAIPVTPQAAIVSKVYDGTTAMTGLRMNLAGLLAGDSVATSGTGSFSTKNAGTNLPYTIRDITLSGTDAGNYYVVPNALSGTDGVITPRPLRVIGLVALDKYYDGTTAAQLVTSGFDFENRVSGDHLTLVSASARFGDPAVGKDKPVFAVVDIGGADAPNYTLLPVTPFADILESGNAQSPIGDVLPPRAPVDVPPPPLNPIRDSTHPPIDAGLVSTVIGLGRNVAPRTERIDVTQSPESDQLSEAAGRRMPATVQCIDGGIRMPAGVTIPTGVDGLCGHNKEARPPVK